MKTILILYILFISLFSFSQTELIAYKSHSGNMEHYKLTGFDNLGEPATIIDSIVKINDSTIVEYTSWGDGWNIYNDTVTNHPVCKLSQSSLDSLKGTYYNQSIKYIDFDPITIKDTIQNDSVIKSIKAFGESEKEESIEIMPSQNENTPPANPKNEINIVYPSSKLHFLWYGLFGIITILSMSLWFKHKRNIVV